MSDYENWIKHLKVGQVVEYNCPERTGKRPGKILSLNLHNGSAELLPLDVKYPKYATIVSVNRIIRDPIEYMKFLMKPEKAEDL